MIEKNEYEDKSDNIILSLSSLYNILENNEKAKNNFNKYFEYEEIIAKIDITLNYASKKIREVNHSNYNLKINKIIKMLNKCLYLINHEIKEIIDFTH